MLDDAGWQSCKISVSNSLDEYLIQDLINQGACIDMFGVGERLITAKSEPVFGGVYKLTAVEDEQGNIIPKIKISENVGKITNPHFKKLYRFFGNDTGKAIADYLCVHDEVVDDTKDLEIFDPSATWKRKTVYDFKAKELLVPIFKTASWSTTCRRWTRSRNTARSRSTHSGTRSSALTTRIPTTSICRRSCGTSSMTC